MSILAVLFLCLTILIILTISQKRKLFSMIRSALKRRQITQLLWAACIVALVLEMITQPKTVYQGAVTGLNLWWNIVFPSLLPFFIISELLMSYGIVHFLGVLMEPVMRPLFNLPGTSSFAMAVGYTSGYPIGAMVTARLRSQRLCTRLEAERLMAFTNNSSPLFMLVAVSVGMFNNPQLGVVIAGAHYISNLTIGLLLRFYGKNDRETISIPSSGGNLILRAFREMFRLQGQEKRAPGKIMGEAVKNATTNLINIGGFIILFAVLIQLLNKAGLIAFLAQNLGLILQPLGFSPSVLPALASGLIEMTMGTRLASQAAAPLSQQLIIVSIILAWSGLSIHAQVASMIAETDIRMTLFFLSRIAHALLAAVYTGFLYRLTNPVAGAIAPPSLSLPQGWNQNLSLWPLLPLALKYFGMMLLIMLTAAILLGLGKKIVYHLKP